MALPFFFIREERLQCSVKNYCDKRRVGLLS